MPHEIKKLAMIGCGSMGGGMALLFAENGIDVSLQDPDATAMDGLVAEAKKLNTSGKVTRHDDYDSLCSSLGAPKVFVWSLPHGNTGDTILAKLMPYLRREDIIIDCGNEHWENTERRQGKCAVRGIRYVGCGVSGGYQAARRGPSMCPASDGETLDLVLPTLRKVAAKDSRGRPCVGKIGTGGAGHYVKMLHNGIEHGMMGAISEAFALLHRGIGMDLDGIADEFDRWNSSGEFTNTFLVWIGADICRTTDNEGRRVLEQVEDKVVQDFTGEEGTGIWSNTEAVEKHVPAPALSTAHFLRLASGDRRQRATILSTFTRDKAHLDTTTHASLLPPQRIPVDDPQAFREDVRRATFAACLLSYCQGMNVISKANKQHHFNISYPDVLQIWRAGCIIQAEYINDTLLTPIYGDAPNDPEREINPLFDANIAAHLREALPALKRVVTRAIEGDHVVPTLSASLEYLKYQTSTDLLAASFYEAELDYFGSHMYDRKGADAVGAPEEGKEHFEWKPA